MCRLKIIQICRVQSTEALPVSFESKLFFALIKRISLSTGDIKLAKRYIYSTLVNVSSLRGMPHNKETGFPVAQTICNFVFTALAI